MSFVVPDEAQRTELAGVLGHAFGTDLAGTLSWFEGASHEQLRILVRQGEVQGGLLRIPMGQAYGGRFVPMTGFAGVGVRVDRRRRGVAKALMGEALRELRSEGVGLSALYASTRALYRAVGYEQAGTTHSGTFKPRDLHAPPDAGAIELATEAHWPEIEEVYRELAVHQPGALDRGPYIWQRIRAERHGLRAFGSLLRNPDGSLEGWVFYRQKKGPDRHILHLSDVQARTADGWGRLARHLVDLGTMVHRVELLTAPTDPLYLRQLHPYMKMELWETWMLRLVDPSVALQQRGYAPGLSAEIGLSVVDPLLGDETLTLRVAEGRARVSKGGTARVRVHTRGLAGLYAGHLSPRVLAVMGLIEGEARDLATLAQLFAGPPPWNRDHF